MTPKTIICPLPLAYTDEKIISVVSLSQFCSAHLVVPLIGLSPAAALAIEESESDGWLQELQDSRSRATSRARFLQDWLADMGVSASVHAFVCELHEISQLTGRYARYADISVASASFRSRGDLRDATLAGLLFGSGRPVLVEPASEEDGELSLTPEVVMIAWNDSLHASRAVSQSLDLLIQARSVHIACVSQRQTPMGPGQMQGAQLARFLERHGVDVSVSELPRISADVDRLLVSHVQAIGAGLVVMGAYGHTPFRERILGGTTIGVLNHCPVPVLMAH
ncbi:MAG: universal stress protein [Burkholderiaceae bacterium]